MTSPDADGPGRLVGVISPAAARYLEAIYCLQAEGGRVRPGQLAVWLGVAPPSVSQAVARLIRDGLVHPAHSRGLLLTPEGAATAEHIVRQRRVAESWLFALGMDSESADEESHHIAYFLSDRVVDLILEQLGRPATCPHGNPIPGVAQPTTI